MATAWPGFHDSTGQSQKPIAYGTLKTIDASLRITGLAMCHAATCDPSGTTGQIRKDYGLLKSGTVIEPSSASIKPGLCATSQA